MPTTQVQSPTQGQRRAIADRVLLLAPSIGSWKGHYQLPKSLVKIELQGVEVNKKKVTVPCTKLIADDYPLDADGTAWKKRFDRLNSRLGGVLDRYSVPFPITGVRMVPEAVGDTFLTEVDDIKRDQLATVDEFIEAFDNVMAEIRRNTDPLVWDHVQRKVPHDRQQMRAKFYLDVIPIQLAGGMGDNELRAVSLADMERHQVLVGESVQRAVSEAVATLVEEPLNQLADKLAALKELIERDGRVTERSYKPVREALAKVRDFMLVPNGELLAAMQQLEDRMRITTPNSLDRVTAAHNGFTALLNSVYSEATDSVRQSAMIEEFGKELRTINVD